MIFLSYSREDRAHAVRLGRALQARGLSVARDPTLVAGDPFWRETVWRTLTETRLMVVLWSRHAARSPWVDQEIRGFSGPRLFLPLDAAPLPPCASLPEAGELGREVRAADAEVRAAPAAAEADGGDPEGEVYRQRACAVHRARAALHEFRRAVRERAPRGTPRNGRVELEDGTVLLPLPGGGRRYLGATPVSNEQFRRFIVQTAFCPPPPTWTRDAFAAPELPVTGVTWFEAAAYAAWAGGRLPTSAEWARGARGSQRGVRFATRDGELDPEAAHFGVQPGRGAPVASTHRPPTPEGFYGMCGNTWDWCATPDGPHRVIRGGGYMDGPRFCRIRARYRNTPIDRDCSVGFRVLAELHP